MSYQQTIYYISVPRPFMATPVFKYFQCLLIELLLVESTNWSYSSVLLILGCKSGSGMKCDDITHWSMSNTKKAYGA